MPRKQRQAAHVDSRARTLATPFHIVILTRVTRPFLIDTDTASDDAVAIIMALRNPDISHP